MSDLAARVALIEFTLFCRIAGCLMLMPGFSSRRVPVRIRLLIAIAVTLALSPLLFSTIEPVAGDARTGTIFALVASETLTGALFGLTGRLYFAALEMAATASANLMGYSGLPGAPVAGDEPIPPLASLITMTATALFFIAELHWLVLAGLVETYTALPPAVTFNPQAALIIIADKLSEILILAGRLAAPFLIYAVVFNLAVGLTNKLSPQIPVFFVSLPFVLAGGLLLFFLISDEILLVFINALKGWLING